MNISLISRALRACLIGIIAILAVGSAPGRAEDAALDTVYVSEQGRDGVFVAQSGHITEITPTWVVLNHDEGSTIYKRAVVDRVVLGPSHGDDDREIADQHWNKRTRTVADRLADTVSRVPWVGGVLATILDLFGARIRLLILIVSLIGIVVYAAYQTYVSVIQRRLNIAKLEMEVLKLRSELQSAGLIPALPDEPKQPLPRQRAAEPSEEVMVSEISVSQLEVRHFVSHSIFGRHTGAQREAVMAKWVKKWQSFSNNWSRRVYFYFRVWLNLIGTLYAFTFALFVIMPFVVYTSGEFEGIELPMSLFYVVTSMIAAVFLPRLRQKFRIMKTSYERASDPQTKTVLN